MPTGPNVEDVPQRLGSVRASRRDQPRVQPSMMGLGTQSIYPTVVAISSRSDTGSERLPVEETGEAGGTLVEVVDRGCGRRYTGCGVIKHHWQFARADWRGLHSDSDWLGLLSPYRMDSFSLYGR